MQELIYEVEFLSDIVLPATSNTEGNIQQLDFVAGSNFLGMVAQNYKEFKDSFEVFHSGMVRFGDATLLVDNSRTYKIPLSYFYEKGKEETLYNHHLIEDFTKFNQLKQKRNGYITKDLKIVYLEYNYSQKSAYDKENRTSLEGSMFGYSAMKKGLKWQFNIKIDESISTKDIELIKSSIVGKKRLGKSKSAQYGLVKIKYIGSEVQDGAKEPLQNETILYFKSRVALIDKNGNPSYDLKYLCDDLKDENIDYPRCQLKTSTFTPYNGAMQTKTYERVVINSGSIIIVNNLSDKQLNEIKRGVGVYLAEGFGEVLINPDFLNEYSPTLSSEASASPKDGDKALPKTSLGLFLNNRKDEKIARLNILNKVDVFINTDELLYKNIKPSQWGKIRSICTNGTDNFADEIKEYISHGTKKWEQKQIDTLLAQCDDLEFIKLLSIQMPKQKGTNNEN